MFKELVFQNNLVDTLKIGLRKAIEDSFYPLKTAAHEM